MTSSEYSSLSQLPSETTVDRVVILDPLVATGGTSIVSYSLPIHRHNSLALLPSCSHPLSTLQACVGMIKDWGIPIEKIQLICILASKTGLEAVSKAYPGLQIW